jgi:peptidoglycan hydrolase-like protein with peptidoglycan-binding domain
VLADTTTTVLVTAVVPDAGATTTTATTGTAAPPPTPPPAPTAPTTPASPASTSPAPTTPCRDVGLNETVRRGDCGDTVTFIQERLTLLGFPVTADGQFGPGTERVVKDFQTARGLTADGIVGEATWAALVEGGIGD